MCCLDVLSYHDRTQQTRVVDEAEYLGFPVVILPSLAFTNFLIHSESHFGNVWTYSSRERWLVHHKVWLRDPSFLS